MKVMSPKPKVAFEEKEEEVEEEKPKTIADEVGELTKKEPVDVPLSGYDGFDGSSDDFPEELIEEDWDMRGRGLQSRLKEGGTQEVPEGSIAIWSTKYGDRENMNVLVINANDAYHILRGLRGVNTKDDKGKLKGVSDAKLKTMYRKILEGTRQGKKETAINDKIFLRLLEIVEPYQDEPSTSEEEYVAAGGEPDSPAGEESPAERAQRLAVLADEDI